MSIALLGAFSFAVATLAFVAMRDRARAWTSATAAQRCGSGARVACTRWYGFVIPTNLQHDATPFRDGLIALRRSEKRSHARPEP